MDWTTAANLVVVMASSGFPEGLITTLLQNPTVEGDSAMLPMQGFTKWR